MWNPIINKSLVYLKVKLNLFYFSCLLKLILNILHSSQHLTMIKLFFLVIVTNIVMSLLILDIFLIISLNL